MPIPTGRTNHGTPERVTSAADDLLARIRGEYREMPGLRLTRAQACRLWQLDDATCDRVVRTLTLEGFLRQTADGCFVAITRTPVTAAIPAARRYRAS